MGLRWGDAYFTKAMRTAGGDGIAVEAEIG
jgi:hypothetical protein